MNRIAAARGVDFALRPGPPRVTCGGSTTRKLGVTRWISCDTIPDIKDNRLVALPGQRILHFNPGGKSTVFGSQLDPILEGSATTSTTVSWPHLDGIRFGLFVAQKAFGFAEVVAAAPGKPEHEHAGVRCGDVVHFRSLERAGQWRVERRRRNIEERFVVRGHRSAAGFLGRPAETWRGARRITPAGAALHPWTSRSHAGAPLPTAGSTRSTPT